jgi:hypothetical protein
MLEGGTIMAELFKTFLQKSFSVDHEYLIIVSRISILILIAMLGTFSKEYIKFLRNKNTKFDIMKIIIYSILPTLILLVFYDGFIYFMNKETIFLIDYILGIVGNDLFNKVKLTTLINIFKRALVAIYSEFTKK